jgi:hypothetical protein
VNSDGHTATFQAVLLNRPEMLLDLLKVADDETKAMTNSEGETWLHLAFKHNSPERLSD